MPRMNETLRVIHSRFSCRAFTDKALPDATLDAIARAAIAAPSAMNRQPWRVIVVKNKKLIDEMDAEGMRVLAAAENKSAYDRILSRGGRLFYNAPCLVALAIEKPAQYAAYDCGIVAQTVTLAAASLGVNSVICGFAKISFSGGRGAEFATRLGFPPDYELGLAVLLGHAASDDGKPHEPDASKISVIA